MGNVRFFLLTAFFLWVFIGTTFASAKTVEECKQIKDATRRIECYDAVTATPKKLPAKIKELTAEKERLAANEAAEKERIVAAVTAGKDALRALKKLETHVGVGVSYREYSGIVSDAKFEVEQFTSSKHARLLPQEVALAMTSAIGHYVIAASHWSRKFQERKASDFLHVSSQSEQAYVDFLFHEYPKMQGVAWFDEHQVLHYGTSLSVIWNAAAEEIQNATTILQKYDDL